MLTQKGEIWYTTYVTIGIVFQGDFYEEKYLSQSIDAGGAAGEDRKSVV